MATFSKIRLSGGVDGLPVLVVQTTTAGTLIHTAHATDQDEVWLYAVNTHSSAVVLTVEFGGVATKDQIKQSIAVAPSGMVLVVPGIPLTNSMVVRCFAATASVITLNGYVNRITA